MRLLSVLLLLASAMSALAQSVQRPDVTIHYTVTGDKGPYVVILCGGPGATVEMLRPFADHLKDRFRCVMLEQRGTGRSALKRHDESTINFDAYIEDIEALRKHLGQEKILILGSSWGMTLGYAYTAAYPDRVSALATVGSGHLSTANDEAWQANLAMRLSAEQQKRLDDLMDRDPRPEEAAVEYLKIILPAYFFDKDVGARFAAAIKPGDLNPYVLLEAPRMIRRVQEYTLDKLGRITCPVFLLQGRQDLASEEVAFLVRDKVKGSKVVLVNRCGHMPWLDQPEITWNALDDFLVPHWQGK